MYRALLALLLLLSPRAEAQEPPACTEAQEGVTAGLAGKLCVCRFQPGGTLTGRPAGHRWDCGALRPACGEGILPPALSAPKPGLPAPKLLLPLSRQDR